LIFLGLDLNTQDITLAELLELDKMQRSDDWDHTSRICYLIASASINRVKDIDPSCFHPYKAKSKKQMQKDKNERMRLFVQGLKLKDK
jgi:hypothetical protein